MNSALTARDIHFDFGNELQEENSFSLSIDSLQIRSGEVHALIGPNGSGKSTFLRLLAGFLTPQSGEILFKEENIQHLSHLDRARRIGFLPQDVLPLFSQSVRDIVLMGRYPWTQGIGLPDSKDLEITQNAMERMQVQSLQARSFDRLSGGERQRVLLASVLAQQTQVLLLDEPTHFLDIHHAVELFQLLKIEARKGLGILVVTHDLTLASHFADVLTLMKSGKIVRHGVVSEVMEESHLRSVYGEQIRVISEPKLDRPYVVPAETVKNSEVFPAMSETDSKRISKGLSSLTLKRFTGILSLFLAASFLIFLLSPFFGTEETPLSRIYSDILHQSSDHWSLSTKIFIWRFPRVSMAFIAGIALGCTGAAFQSLLRNPLAEPYTLGIASSSSLGAVLALSFPVLSFVLGPISGTQIWALGFALLSIALLTQLQKYFRWSRGMTSFLLIGITINLIASATILLVRYLASPLTARAIDQWMIGGIDITGWQEILPSLPLLIPGFVLLLSYARELNQIELGDEMARARGIEIERVRKHVFLAGSLMTASVVAAVGPIGFIGLIIPHITRKLIGTDLRLVLPCSALAGGFFLVVADALARSLTIGGRGAELPVGILTSMFGGIIFLSILLRSKAGTFRS
jgi:iron complex transport system permease protein